MVFSIKRRETSQVMVGNIGIGSQYPIRVQSMTNTDTEDVDKTVEQIVQLANAGSELVRITVNTEKSAKAVPYIIEKIKHQNVDIPIIGDFHFNGHRLLKAEPKCAEFLSKLRINPGNVGRGEKKDRQFSSIIEVALKYNKPVRIGVNWGSLDQQILQRLLDENVKAANPISSDALMNRAMIASALDSVSFAKSLGMQDNQMLLSVKVSQIQQLIRVYEEIAELTHLPLHLGLTEAGMGVKGVVASAAALSILLQKGIGDTIRVSLTPEPKASRTEEVKVAREILQSLQIRSFSPRVIACPGCGRTSSDYFQYLAQEIQAHVDHQMQEWKKYYLDVESLSVAVMGCVVNGPGESKLANIGISLPGSGETPIAPVYINGERVITLKGDQLTEDFKKIIDQYVTDNYERK